MSNYKKKNDFVVYAQCILAVATAIVVCYFCFKLERVWHYNSSYRSMVQEQIDASVKPLQQQIDDLKARR